MCLVIECCAKMFYPNEAHFSVLLNEVSRDSLSQLDMLQQDQAFSTHFLTNPNKAFLSNIRCLRQVCSLISGWLRSASNLK